MSERRVGLPGELCTCGRQAVFVYEGGEFTATGDCGQRDGGLPVDGVCSFCGDTVDHAAYWAAEDRAGRPAASAGTEPQGGRCPLYRLRLADPLPVLRVESVAPFDRDVDQRTRSEGRLRQELVALFESLGADFTAARVLDFDDETGDLEDVVVDIVWVTRAALGRDPGEATSRDPDAGQSAVAALVGLLAPRLDELGVTPNPLDGVDARVLVDRAGGDEAWTETVACDRPLLIVRRVVRRALDPEAPRNIYREWWP